MDQILLDFRASRGTIAPEIYGHFTEHIGGVIYDGIWHNGKLREELIEELKKLEPPVIRWPGGCFAEEYDWTDGIGPRESRPTTVNVWYSQDKKVETNEFGTHEFMEFCRRVGAKPYFAANLASVAPMHIRNWMEYCNAPEGLTTLARKRAENGDPAPFNVPYWGLGNENWGGGGCMSARQYARAFRQLKAVTATVGNMPFMDNVGQFNITGAEEKRRGFAAPGLKVMACGPTENGPNGLQWTEDFLAEYVDTTLPTGLPDGFSMHYYCPHTGDPLSYTQDEWEKMLFIADEMRHHIDRHRKMMDKYDPRRKIALVVDEWGNWHHDGSGPSKGANLYEQQSTLRDAAVAGITLNDFNNRCDVVAMANVAQLVNNIHSLFLTSGDRICKTPTYHVFEMYMPHKGARQIGVVNGSGFRERKGFMPMPQVHASASEKDGYATITLVNTDMTRDRQVKLGAIGGKLGEATVKLLYSADPHDHNDFENPDRVTVREGCLNNDNVLTIPAAGIAAVTWKKI